MFMPSTIQELLRCCDVTKIWEFYEIVEYHCGSGLHAGVDGAAPGILRSRRRVAASARTAGGIALCHQVHHLKARDLIGKIGVIYDGTPRDTSDAHGCKMPKVMCC